MPAIPALEIVPYLTSDLLDADEAGRLTDLPESLIVLGGGHVAVELAQMFSRLGTRATIVARSGLLRGCEPELATTLSEVFAGEPRRRPGGARSARLGMQHGTCSRASFRL